MTLPQVRAPIAKARAFFESVRRHHGSGADRAWPQAFNAEKTEHYELGAPVMTVPEAAAWTSALFQNS